ncbi:MAG: DUF393 domain-containing protein [Bacteroidetes bacterium]|nr:DUF393 domain-containing protein [Bacteroidota bacterium]
MPEKYSIVLFDGVCNYCNTKVNFIIRHDNKDHFRFTPLQSALAKKILTDHGLDPEQMNSFVLYENDKCFFKTTAILRMAKHLGGLYPLLYALIIIPAPIRDIYYNIIAKNRYKWWGKKESCMVPTPEVRKKFL